MVSSMFTLRHERLYMRPLRGLISRSVGKATRQRAVDLLARRNRPHGLTGWSAACQQETNTLPGTYQWLQNR